ncbi:MAG TPA: polysaccharide biosynthesis tyrosine autokinase [Deltaproteobacteria bacterium]|nr:polysaccharide biosynthesis tyrosine autokinase [Deltaproteobacteria bacterium]
MKDLKEKNYYEVLNVPRSATAEEIAEAYSRAKSAFCEDSPALYSLYSEEERKDTMDLIDEAYETLKDPEKKGRYDALLDTAASAAADEGPLTALGGFDDDADLVRESLGVDAYREVTLKARLAVADDADPVAAEQYRVLYTKLEQVGLKKSCKVFAVTSALKGEGKTTTAFNLSYIMGREFRKKTLLVECDFKHPAFAPYLDAVPAFGLPDVLSGEAELGETILRVAHTDLYVLPALRSVKNSISLLGSREMALAVNSFRREFDYIIVDAPPVLSLADMNVLSKVVDAMILVVRAGKTPRDMVNKAIASLQESDIAGIVLNGAETTLKKYGYYY